MMRFAAVVLVVLVTAGAVAAQSVSPPVADVDQAVVLISVAIESGGRTVRGSGSGIIIDAGGLILTAAHVVRSAQTMDVTLWSGQSLPARLVGVDPLFDAALIRIDAAAPLPTATLGNAAALASGALLTALGRAPRRQAGPTAGEFIDVDLEARPGVPNLRASARVWPGDSGGALIDGRGEVVGLIVAVTRDGTISLSLSMDAVKRLMPDLLAGSVRHPWLGVSGRTLTPELAQQLGLAGRNGIVVLEVVPGGPAASAGLRAGGPAPSGELPRDGDLIVAIDGQPVTTFGAMAAYVLGRKIGDSVTVQVLRSGELLTTTIVLGERPSV
ncbi:MAG TPA: trypsin-like peptidase domain-containing protein [bacterium]